MLACPTRRSDHRVKRRSRSESMIARRDRTRSERAAAPRHRHRRQTHSTRTFLASTGRSTNRVSRESSNPVTAISDPRRTSLSVTCQPTPWGGWFGPGSRLPRVKARCLSARQGALSCNLSACFARVVPRRKARLRWKVGARGRGVVRNWDARARLGSRVVDPPLPARGLRPQCAHRETFREVRSEPPRSGSGTPRRVIECRCSLPLPQPKSGG